jgi:hypothetical protein
MATPLRGSRGIVFIMWRWDQVSVLSLANARQQRHITREATEEIKYDGFRSLACSLISRKNHPYKSFVSFRQWCATSVCS